MELIDVINKRKSIRKFQDQDVQDELLNELIETARRCPSAGAIRGFQAIITRENLAYNAPVCVVFCTDPEKYANRYGDRGRELYSVQDATIFASYFQLLLVDKGLSSVWVGAFRENKIKRILNTELRPIAIIALGYKQN
jgi:nitroreductase